MGEVIQTLWDSGALGAIFTGLVTILGQLSALNTQKYTAVLEALQKQQTAGRHNGARRGIYSHKGRRRNVDAQVDDVCGVRNAWNRAVCVCVF